MKKLSCTVIYEEDPDGGFVASVPALPGCYSQGETLEETEQHITEAIELYLKTLHDDQHEAPENNPLQARVEVVF